MVSMQPFVYLLTTKARKPPGLYYSRKFREGECQKFVIHRAIIGIRMGSGILPLRYSPG